MSNGLDLGKPAPDLPQSAAGRAGGTAGSLGGSTDADLQRGYMHAGPGEEAGEPGGDIVPMQPLEGFLSRPGGWER